MYFVSLCLFVTQLQVLELAHDIAKIIGPTADHVSDD